MQQNKLPFKVYRPMPRQDEDAPPIIEDQLLGVFDGMGGAGSMKITDAASAKTNAYHASRVVADVVERYCRIEDPALVTTAFREEQFRGELARKMKYHIFRNITDYASKNKIIANVRIRSQMVKILPTTMAVLIYRDSGSFVDLLCLWAGDSRCFAITPYNGLQQLTKDDLNIDQDAMCNITEDSAMSNCIHISTVGETNTPSFKINYAFYNGIQKPCILFCASDGCFAYRDSPMHFEKLLLEALSQTDENHDYSNVLADMIVSPSAHDDCTIAGVLLAEMPVNVPSPYKEFEARYAYLCKEFIPQDNLPKRIKLAEDDMSIAEQRKKESMENLCEHLFPSFSDSFVAFLDKKPIENSIWSKVPLFGTLVDDSSVVKFRELYANQEQVEKELGQQSKELRMSFENDFFDYVRKNVDSRLNDKYNQINDVLSEIQTFIFVTAQSISAQINTVLAAYIIQFLSAEYNASEIWQKSPRAVYSLIKTLQDFCDSFNPESKQSQERAKALRMNCELRNKVLISKKEMLEQEFYELTNSRQTRIPISETTTALLRKYESNYLRYHDVDRQLKDTEVMDKIASLYNSNKSELIKQYIYYGLNGTATITCDATLKLIEDIKEANNNAEQVYLQLEDLKREMRSELMQCWLKYKTTYEAYANCASIGSSG
jgi:serine/threonine protein phosphatase PrpC